MADADISLRINAEISTALNQIKNFSAQTTTELKKVQEQTSKSSQIFSSFVGNLGANIATKGLELVGSAITSLVDITAQGIDSAIEYESALNQLTNSFELTGIASQATVKDFEEFANGLEENSKFTDDAILNNAAYIQSLAQLDSDGLKRATQGAVDLASALGKDLGEASAIVAKAANGNVAALGKLGVEVQKGKSDAETFANALKALEQRFGGSGKRALDTFGGATTQLRNAFDDAQKALGNLVVKSPAVVGAIKGIGIVVNQIGKFLETAFAGKDPFRVIIEYALVFARGLINIVGRPVQAIVELIGANFNALRTTINGFVTVALGYINVFAQGLNSLGIVSDSAVQVVNDLFKTSAEQTAEFARQTKESYMGVFDQGAINTALAALDTVEQSVQSTTKVGRDSFANMGKGAQDASKQIDEAFKGKIIELAIKIGDPEETRAKLEQQFAVIDAAVEQRTITEEQAAEAKRVAEVEAEMAQVDAIIAVRQRLATYNEEDALSRLELQNQVVTEQLALAEKGSASEIALKKRQAQLERNISQQKLQYAGEFFGNMASLMQTGNKELFEIGKAAALAEAVVSGALAVQKALALGGFAGIALAASVGVKTAVNIATISAQKLATGMTEIPKGFSNDTFPALLSSGERVISTPQNQDLKQFISQESGGSRAITERLDTLVSVMGGVFERLGSLENEFVVNIGGKEITREVRESLRAGRVLEA